jgi:hypothetical protein
MLKCLTELLLMDFATKAIALLSCFSHWLGQSLKSIVPTPFLPTAPHPIRFNESQFFDGCCNLVQSIACPHCPMIQQPLYDPHNPHPLSQMRTELVWEGKYDEYGQRREVDVADCAMPLTPIPLLANTSPASKSSIPSVAILHYRRSGVRQ